MMKDNCELNIKSRENEFKKQWVLLLSGDYNAAIDMYKISLDYAMEKKENEKNELINDKDSVEEDRIEVGPSDIQGAMLLLFLGIKDLELQVHFFIKLHAIFDKLDELCFEFKNEEIKGDILKKLGAKKDCYLSTQLANPMIGNTVDVSDNEYIISEKALWYLDCIKKTVKEVSFKEGYDVSDLKRMTNNVRHLATPRELEVILQYTGDIPNQNHYAQLIQCIDAIVGVIVDVRVIRSQNIVIDESITLKNINKTREENNFLINEFYEEYQNDLGNEKKIISGKNKNEMYHAAFLKYKEYKEYEKISAFFEITKKQNSNIINFIQQYSPKVKKEIYIKNALETQGAKNDIEFKKFILEFKHFLRFEWDINAINPQYSLLQDAFRQLNIHFDGSNIETRLLKKVTGAVNTLWSAQDAEQRQKALKTLKQCVHELPGRPKRALQALGVVMILCSAALLISGGLVIAGVLTLVSSLIGIAVALAGGLLLAASAGVFFCSRTKGIAKDLSEVIRQADKIPEGVGKLAV